MTVSQTSLQRSPPLSPPSVKSNSGWCGLGWGEVFSFYFYVSSLPSSWRERINRTHIFLTRPSLSPLMSKLPPLKLVSWLFVFIETPLQFLKISAQKIRLNFCRVWLNSYFVRRLFEYLLGRQLFKSQTVLTGNLLQ